MAKKIDHCQAQPFNYYLYNSQQFSNQYGAVPYHLPYQPMLPPAYNNYFASVMQYNNSMQRNAPHHMVNNNKQRFYQSKPLAVGYGKNGKHYPQQGNNFFAVDNSEQHATGIPINTTSNKRWSNNNNNELACDGKINKVKANNVNFTQKLTHKLLKEQTYNVKEMLRNQQTSSGYIPALLPTKQGVKQPLVVDNKVEGVKQGLSTVHVPSVTVIKKEDDSILSTEQTSAQLFTMLMISTDHKDSLAKTELNFRNFIQGAMNDTDHIKTTHTSSVKENKTASQASNRTNENEKIDPVDNKEPPKPLCKKVHFKIKPPTEEEQQIVNKKKIDEVEKVRESKKNIYDDTLSEGNINTLEEINFYCQQIMTKFLKNEYSNEFIKISDDVSFTELGMNLQKSIRYILKEIESVDAEKNYLTMKLTPRQKQELAVSVTDQLNEFKLKPTIWALMCRMYVNALNKLFGQYLMKDKQHRSVANSWMWLVDV